MTDAEFLDELQRRAASSMTPIVTASEWGRVDRICGRAIRLVVAPAGKDWTVAPDSLYGAVRLARREMVEAVVRRLKA